MKKMIAVLMGAMVCGSFGGIAHSLIVGEGFVNPLGFHDATPAFSWKLPRGVVAQSAFQIEVRDIRSQQMVWDSGWVESTQSVLVPYGGTPLASRQQLSWRVQFRDNAGKESEWSSPSFFELGLLSSKDWKAKWIRSEAEINSGKEPVSWMRREFPVTGKIEQARLYVTARGLFEMHLNGEKVGNDCFVPGWTSYSNRIDTLTYDVTEVLQQGDNALGAELGMGWYAGHLVWEGQKNLYGKHPQLLLQLEISYADGTKQTVLSDESWRVSLKGPIRSSSIYHGEEYDARMERPGWNKSGFDDSEWSSVLAEAELGSERLTPKPFAPVRITETLETQKITELSPGRFVFDLGQNMVGWVALNIPVEKDQTVTVRFSEMLNQDGTLYTDNYRAAKSTDTYTAAQAGTIEWRPTFTFHGFRYVELSGLLLGANPELDWVKGEVLHSDLPRVGLFESSHEKLNQLQSNIVWGQRGNFLDIPTDCPQRDERLGWTGDAQVFCPTSMFNYDCHAFWKSWLGSMRDDQMANGAIPHVVPDVLGHGDSAGWLDAATFIPWEVYVRTGDTEVLAENVQMMKRLIEYYRKQAEHGRIETRHGKGVIGFGDWLQPHAPSEWGETSLALLTTAFYARSTQILADSLHVLGKTAEAKQYTAEAAVVRKAFAKHYFDADGKLKNAPETQTAYLLAIAFDLIPDALQKKAAAHLVQRVHEADDHLRTGFLGTPYITSVLDKTGYTDLAFTVLFKETYPSWFFSINQGATTLWERWNSYSHEAGFGNDGMNSFNHYAYGAINRWMVERIAGLAPDPSNPGYKHFFIRPLIGSQLDWVRVELDTPYGKASSGWEKTDGKLEMNLVVPPNTTATIEFPNGRPPETVSAGSHHFSLEL